MFHLTRLVGSAWAVLRIITCFLLLGLRAAEPGVLRLKIIGRTYVEQLMACNVKGGLVVRPSFTRSDAKVMDEALPICFY